MTTTKPIAPIGQLPAVELRALRDRMDGWMRKAQALIADIETVREHYDLAGVTRTRHGGWVTVSNLLPHAELLEQLVSGGTIYFDTDQSLETVLESGSISDALGTVSVAMLQQQREAGAA